LQFIKLGFLDSGAIEIFKRTGSITKLQKAMGHSSINVSLTYLRGLEIAELKEEDMPMEGLPCTKVEFFSGTTS